MSLDTYEVTSTLIAHLRGLSKPPIVFEEVALEGSWGSHGRLDVVTLTIAPHYRGAQLKGYEVKTARRDLLQDFDKLKFRRYMKAVASLTLAMPAGLARLEEIPTELGVMTYHGKGRWTTARRATVNDARGNLTVDTAMRLIRRLDTHREFEARKESKLDRLKRIADAETEYALRLQLSQQARDMIDVAQKAKAEYERRLEQLEAREAALEGADDVLNRVGELLARCSRAANLGQQALGRGWGGIKAMDRARADLDKILEDAS